MSAPASSSGPRIVVSSAADDLSEIVIEVDSVVKLHLDVTAAAVMAENILAIANAADDLAATAGGAR